MKKGFTIIELLIVIMLIGLLAAVTITSYNKTRQSAELSLLTDQFIADLREMKSKTSNASSECVGFKVDNSGQLFTTTATYLNPVQKCDLNTLTESQKYTTKNLKVVSIQRENIDTPLSSIDVLFTPPHGDVYVPFLDLISSQSEPPQDNIIFQLGLGSKTNEQKILLNRKNGTIQKTFE